MPRPETQARAARKLRRDNPWIAASPAARALAQQLVTLAEVMDVAEEPTAEVAATASAYIATQRALLDLAPRA